MASQREALQRERSRREGSRRAFAVWNALTWWLWPLVGLYTLRRTRGKHPKSRAWLREAWGGPSAAAIVNRQSSTASPTVWVHAVSVGETMAARPVARALRHAMPCRIVVSSTTESGHETALSLVRDGLADAAIYFPVDVPFAVRRALRRVKPDIVLLMETELWPTFLHLARELGAHVVLVNGRVSDNLFATARRFAPLYRWMLGNLDAALMRSPAEAARLKQLPAPPGFAARVRAVGDVKLDQESAAPPDPSARATWRATLGIAPDAPFWVAGSTHEGEDEMVLDAYVTLRAEFPGLRLLIAPRHIERAEDVARLAGEAGCAVRRRSEGPSAADEVLLLDTVGELAAIYAACDVAFVGGSLVERGGHNLLEPVLAGAPVVWGPHVANFREAAQLAREAKLGSEVADAAALAAAVGDWLRALNERAQIPQRAEAALKPHRGAARRVAEVVANCGSPVNGFIG